MKPIIIIPARYNSSRFPGKPLTLIAGKTMLQRVCDVASAVQKNIPNTDILVATDNQTIMNHAQEININCVLTPLDCKTGSDRVLSALKTLSYRPDIVINLQGDAPLTPPLLIESLINTLSSSKEQVATPAIQLTWEELNTLRDLKKENAFSGTTVIINNKDNAIWFSKNIIPAIRNEEKLRATDKLSPVFKHYGLYGYKTEMLEKFARLPEGKFEKLEGLEQLRLLENGFNIKIIKFNNALLNLSTCVGVDTLHDAKFVEDIILNSEN